MAKTSSSENSLEEKHNKKGETKNRDRKQSTTHHDSDSSESKKIHKNKKKKRSVSNESKARKNKKRKRSNNDSESNGPKNVNSNMDHKIKGDFEQKTPHIFANSSQMPAFMRHDLALGQRSYNQGYTNLGGNQNYDQFNSTYDPFSLIYPKTQGTYQNYLKPDNTNLHYTNLGENQNYGQANFPHDPLNLIQGTNQNYLKQDNTNLYPNLEQNPNMRSSALNSLQRLGTNTNLQESFKAESSARINENPNISPCLGIIQNHENLQHSNFISTEILINTLLARNDINTVEQVKTLCNKLFDYYPCLFCRSNHFTKHHLDKKDK